MPTPVLVTKLFAPPARPEAIARPRLHERLDAGLRRKMTLVSAPAGFGKSTLVGGWAASCGRPAAWLSLDEGDNDPVRFLTYLVAALRTVAPDLGEAVLGALQAPQPPSPVTVVTTLVNELAALPRAIVLVLDDYHVIGAGAVDEALAFLLEHLPPQVHLVVASREDPALPLARLRTRGQLAELRAADLRFTAAEAAAFLAAELGLALPAADVAALEERTEGWIAGLQLAAISMRNHDDVGAFVRSFTGSHRFVMDYLVEEVLGQQPAAIQGFLLRTSILERLCAPLCDAVLQAPPGTGQALLAQVERANLFLVPLDDERRWYRYHHLFAELLRQRLQAAGEDVAALHGQASAWYEAHGSALEAFRHAAAAQDLARAERLVDGDGMPLELRGGGALVRQWLESLPPAAMDARPSLWVAFAATLMYAGRHDEVAPKLAAAEAALRGHAQDAEARHLHGRIALLRGTLALMKGEAEALLAQADRALADLRPDDATGRTTATWLLGCAHQLQGDRVAASALLQAAADAGRTHGDFLYTFAAAFNLAQVQEADTRLDLAAATYRRALELVGDASRAIGSQAHLGLARIAYERGDLAAAEEHGRTYVELTRQLESIESFAPYAAFQARLRLARGDGPGALAVLDEADAVVRARGLAFQVPLLAGARVATLLRLGRVPAAAALARAHDLPLAQARVALVQGDPARALALLAPLRVRAEARGWHDDRLAAMVLEALAHQAREDLDGAVPVLAAALALAEPGGLVRTFVDEGAPMARLLAEAAARGALGAFGRQVRAAFDAEGPPAPPDQAGPDALSERELEVLRLVALGLSNQAIGQRLHLALSTVKGHNMRIFEKLRVERRTEAVARARELGLV